jgi:pimeloyl-ACP methyl ester carboxylesterase
VSSSFGHTFAEGSAVANPRHLRPNTPGERLRDMVPETRFAWHGDVALAYQVFGDGPMDFLYIPGWLSNVDVMWESPAYEGFLRRLATFSRVIVMDRRGCGCSERFSPHDVDPLEVHVDDALVVLDAVGSDRAAFFSFDEGTFIGCLLAASRPDRISHLVLLDPSPCWTRNEEISWEWSEEQWRSKVEQDRRDWGSYEALRRDEPDTPERDLRWEAKFNRQSQSPGAGAAETMKYSRTDVRAVLPTIRVPTLVVHGSKRPSTSVDVRSPRYVAEHIPDARFVEVAAGHLPWDEGALPLVDEIEEFLTGTHAHPGLERVLTTILFTDIVGSTSTAAQIGDQAWREVQRRHHDIVRLELDRFRGLERDTSGDGFFATFDGPARAVLCAKAIGERVQSVGLAIRAGVHTGEIELTADGPSGISVHIGARVASLAGANEVWASSTVRDLTAGSDLVFEDVGEHELKGVPDRWRLYRVS